MVAADQVGQSFVETAVAQKTSGRSGSLHLSNSELGTALLPSAPAGQSVGLCSLGSVDPGTLLGLTGPCIENHG